MSIWRDVRSELRSLRNAPGFTAVMLLTLFLAVGANGAVFSVIRAVLLQPLPFHEPSRLVWISQEAKAMGLDAALGSDFLQWKAGNEVFENIAAFTPTEVNWRGKQFPQRVRGARVSVDFFAVLGVQPALGRVFTEPEDRPGGPAAAILSYALWRDEFGERSDILGKAALIDGRPVSIVGVMPPDFDFPPGARIWRPLALNVDQEMSRERVSLLRVIGRLRRGVGYERARSDLGLIHERIAQQFPGMYGQIRVTLTPLASRLVSKSRSPLLFLFGAVVLLLLIACANLTALLLARGAARSREMGVRAALGASRGRLMRQAFVQSLLLSFIGGAAALAASPFILEALLPFAPPDFPRIADTRVDGAVVGFTLAVCLLVSLLCGLGPALTAMRAHPGSLLRGERPAGPRSLRVRSGLVVGEVALAQVLLIGSGLLLHSLWRLAQVDPGLDSESVLTMAVKLSGSDYPDQSRKWDYLNRLLEGLRSLPGVEAAGASNSLPLAGSPLTGPVELESDVTADADRPRVVGWFGVTPAYFRTMGMELLAGRGFLPTDRGDAPAVAVVNERFARLFLTGENPVGQRIRPEESDAWLEVVGLVGDALNSGFDQPAEPEIYRPLAQLAGFDAFSAVIRARAQPSRLAAPVRKLAFQINPNQPIYDLHTMDEIVRREGSSRRFVSALVALFSLLALVLAAVGVYGLIAYAVTCRSQEIGIRISLGACKGEAIRLFVGRGLVLVLIGVALGLAGSVALKEFISSRLYGVTTTDPATLIFVSLFFVAVGLSACYFAARRISKLDPWKILRYE